MKELIVTDTLPIEESKRFPELTVLPIAPVLAKAIDAVFEDDSVAKIFDGDAEGDLVWLGNSIQIRMPSGKK